MSSKKQKCSHVSKEHMFEGHTIALQQAKFRADADQAAAVLGARANDYASRMKKLYGVDMTKGDSVNFDTGAIVYAEKQKP